MMSEVVLVRDLADRVHVDGAAGEVNGDERARARGDGRLDRGWVDVHRVALTVDEHRDGAGVNDRVSRRAERHRGGDDLVPCPHARRRHRQVKCGRARRGRERVVDADHARERALELVHAGTGADPRRLEGAGRCGNLFGPDARAAEDDVRILGRLAGHDFAVDSTNVSLPASLVRLGLDCVNGMSALTREAGTSHRRGEVSYRKMRRR